MNGKVTKMVGEDHAGRGEDDRKSSVTGERIAEPALRSEEQHEYHAGDHGRYGERKVDQRKQQISAPEAELRDEPGCSEPEDQVGRQRDGGGDCCEPQGRHRERVRDAGQIKLKAFAKGLGEDRNHGQQNQKPNERDGGADNTGYASTLVRCDG